MRGHQSFPLNSIQICGRFMRGQSFSPLKQKTKKCKKRETEMNDNAKGKQEKGKEGEESGALTGMAPQTHSFSL